MSPSQDESEVGRLAAVPPGSEHSMIESPEGSAVMLGNPVPDTVIVCPLVYGPAGVNVTAGPDDWAEAWPGRNATSAAAPNRATPASWIVAHVRRRAHIRSTEAVTSVSLREGGLFSVSHVLL